MFRSRKRGGVLGVEIQSDDIGADLKACVMVALRPAGTFGKPVNTLNPIIQIDGAPFVLNPLEIATVEQSAKGAFVRKLSDDEATAARRAIDYLLDGH